MKKILRGLCKRPYEQERKSTARTEEFNDQVAEGKDIILVDHHELSHGTKENEERQLGCKNMKIFAFICRKDIPTACFYSTLNLKRLASFNRRLHLVYPMKMKREEVSVGVGISNNKADSNEHVRNKVLHATEASFLNSETKYDKMKPVSRMKELVRWAEKGGKFNGRKFLQFRRRGIVKEIDKDDEEISGPITSSFAATGHVTCGKGNWVTSDSEFVVLEL
ncbi:uncharacterized protein LOC114757804 isoform X2 [Neltuma alba]|uniref:uncharacterized protein LOC114757804 isoform X2 n=1 Tax=Neltuma alba TaxID=207710 RepID=UPI0010A498CA|nr:uncharacterized protein LOC114757804 isoform X2 [Prosopis alba]